MINNNVTTIGRRNGFYINIENIKVFFIVLYVCGWLLPKISLGGLSLGIQDLACLLLLIRFKIRKDLLSIFYGELAYSIFLVFYSVVELISAGGLDGILISVRVFLFVIAGIGILRYEMETIRKSLRVIMRIYIAYFLYNFLLIIYSLTVGGVSLIVFLRGYGDFRIKAPFEGGGTTTVPIGYMFSILLTATLVLYGKWTNFFISLCALGTASRSAILSVFIVHGFKMNYKKVSSWFLAVPFVILFAGFVIMKSYSSDSGDIDGSSSKRLDLYSYAISMIWHQPSALLLGFGVSAKALDASIGESFFESMLFNSLMQGGVILLLSSAYILIKSVYYDNFYKLNYISIPILIGNLIGGSNYFSMFAFPLMVVIIVHTIGNKPSFNYSKNLSNA